MNEIVVVSVVAPFFLFVICVGGSLLLAQRRNAELVKHSPGVLPYTWGFFLGYSGIIGGLFTAAAGGVLAALGLYQPWFLVVLVYLVLMGIASYGVLTRRRWGWMFHIPLSLNPALWAFNSIYAGNRWREIQRQ